MNRIKVLYHSWRRRHWLARKKREAIARAEAYQREYGDPLENMSAALASIVGEADDEWDALLEDPYG